MNLLYDLPTPVIFAHRGDSAHAPENTMRAFELAIQNGADGIELDAKLTADGEAVVIHDQTVDRTTNGHGFVNHLTLSAIKELDAGYYFSSDEIKSPIPTLNEICESIGKKTYINIELTNYASPNDELPDKVAEIILHHQLEERVLLSSFLRLNLIRIRKILPDVPVALLCGLGMMGLPARSCISTHVSPHIIHPHYSDTTPRYMEREKRRGRRVHVWTVNDDSVAQKMIGIGVDGIFTDDPERILHTIGR